MSYQVTLDLAYDEAYAKVIEVLKTEGFGALTEIDVKATMKAKLDADFRKYVIIGACNAPLAHKALSADLNIGLFLPCNVTLYEDDDGKTVVNFLNPGAMASISGNPALDEIGVEGEAKIKRMAEALKS
jgi:uncharacterized protein (DUF302 family)